MLYQLHLLLFFCPQTASETSDVSTTSVPVRKDMGDLFPKELLSALFNVEFVTWNWLFIFRG